MFPSVLNRVPDGVYGINSAKRLPTDGFERSVVYPARNVHIYAIQTAEHNDSSR